MTFQFVSSLAARSVVFSCPVGLGAGGGRGAPLRSADEPRGCRAAHRHEETCS